MVLIDTDGAPTTPPLMMALNSPDLEILGVTTVGGNATLVPLDVCRQTYVGREDLPWIPGRSKTATLSNRTVANWFRGDPDRARYERCDPLAVAAAVQPGLLTYRRGKVTVETSEKERRGGGG